MNGVMGEVFRINVPMGAGIFGIGGAIGPGKFTKLGYHGRPGRLAAAII